MARRTPKAADAAEAAGQPPSAHPTAYVGRNAHGAVRPADDRFLEDEELDARDAYLLEVTGPEAQQLVAKRQTLRVLLDQVEDDRLTAFMPTGYEGSADGLRDRLEADATTMRNAEYRDLTAALEDVLDVQRQENAAEATSAEEGEQP